MNLTRRTEFTHPGMPAAPRSCLPGRTRDLGRSVWNDALPRSRRSKAGQQYGEPLGMGIQTLGSVSVLIFGVSRMISLGCVDIKLKPQRILQSVHPSQFAMTLVPRGLLALDRNRPS